MIGGGILGSCSWRSSCSTTCPAVATTARSRNSPRCPPRPAAVEAAMRLRPSHRRTGSVRQPVFTGRDPFSIPRLALSPSLAPDRPDNGAHDRPDNGSTTGLARRGRRPHRRPRRHRRRAGNSSVVQGGKTVVLLDTFKQGTRGAGRGGRHGLQRRHRGHLRWRVVRAAIDQRGLRHVPVRRRADHPLRELHEVAGLAAVPAVRPRGERSPVAGAAPRGRPRTISLMRLSPSAT